MRKTAFLLFAFFAFLFFNARGAAVADPFDAAFTKIATEVASADIKKAFKLSDSLLAHSKNNLQRTKSMMLLADLHLRSGNIAKALGLATQAEKLAKEDKNTIWQARIAGFLSSVYQNADLNIEARKYLDIAEKINSGLEPSPRTTSVLALIHQQKAYFAVYEDKDFSLARKELQQAEKYYASLPSKPADGIFIATNDQLYGLCYFEDKDYTKAKQYYLKALDGLGTTESELKAFIYGGLGDIALATGLLPEALEQYRKSEAYATKSNNNNAKLIIYKSLSAYYSAAGDTKKALGYQQDYAALREQQVRVAKATSTQLIAELGENEKNHITTFRLLLALSGLLVIALTILIFLSYRSRKTNRLRYKQLLARLEASDSFLIERQEPGAKINGAKPEQQSIMTKESEERLVQGLETLEAKEFFLDGDVSLSSVAGKLNSNTKYLSYVVNKYKQKDFNNYVNELRVRHAIKDLRSDPSTRRYKISYLAERYGFSSHSKFTAIFRSITGITPSVFLDNLKQDESFS